MQVIKEYRRQTLSYTIPFLYVFFEILLIWISISIIERSINILTWTLLSYLISIIWVLYTFSKLKKNSKDNPYQYKF